jgi:(2R)-sulfolactate sulfo-lyase subunit alpha
VKKGILLHETDDDVGVATMELSAGELIEALTLEGEAVTQVELVEDVPLAHKVAVKAIGANQDVLEYGRAIGSSTEAIARGAHVHTHNVLGKRWSGRSQIVEHHQEQS